MAHWVNNMVDVTPFAAFPDDNRNLVQKVTDKLLMLYLVDNVNYVNDLKMNKLIYFIERDSIKKKNSIFNYIIFRYLHGPWSPQITSDFKALQMLDLLTIDNSNLNGNGKRILRDFNDTLEENGDLTIELDEFLENFGSKTGEELKELAYEEPIEYNGKEMHMEDIPLRSIIVKPLEKLLSESYFELSEAQVETLAFLFNTEIMRLNEESFSSKILTFEEVFSR